jgi:hypothetical protein
MSTVCSRCQTGYITATIRKETKQFEIQHNCKRKHRTCNYVPQFSLHLNARLYLHHSIIWIELYDVVVTLYICIRYVPGLNLFRIIGYHDRNIS